MNKIEIIKKLRNELGVSLDIIKKAIDAVGPDYGKAKEYLAKNHRVRDTGSPLKAGLIFTMHHPQDAPRIGVILEVRCSTDFVARNSEFKKLCHELALQKIAGLDGPLLEQVYIRDASVTVGDLVKETSQKVAEPIEIFRNERWEIPA